MVLLELATQVDIMRMIGTAKEVIKEATKVGRPQNIRTIAINKLLAGTIITTVGALTPEGEGEHRIRELCVGTSSEEIA